MDDVLVEEDSAEDKDDEDDDLTDEAAAAAAADARAAARVAAFAAALAAALAHVFEVDLKLLRELVEGFCRLGLALLSCESPISSGRALGAVPVT